MKKIENFRRKHYESIAFMTSILTDEEALAIKTFFPLWQINEDYKKNNKFRYNNKLYKVLQDHTSQENWLPGEDTESLYQIIDETHTGAFEDPIPYEGNMILEKDKYYIQNNIIYLCIRNSETAIYHNLSDLIDLYVIQV